jgi:hypothetical protein
MPEQTGADYDSGDHVTRIMDSGGNLTGASVSLSVIVRSCVVRPGRRGSTAHLPDGEGLPVLNGRERAIAGYLMQEEHRDALVLHQQHRRLKDVGPPDDKKRAAPHVREGL